MKENNKKAILMLFLLLGFATANAQETPVASGARNARISGKI